MKLPPIRVIAAELGVAPATVAASWGLLARSGAIHTDGRRGTTIADTAAESSRYRRALEHETVFDQDLSTGVPDSRLLPDLARALQNLTTAPTPASYLDDPVLPELVETLRRDWPHEPEEFTIVDGAMDALELTARTLLRFGDRVVVEHPTFPPLLDLLDSIGVQVVGVPLDEHGMHIPSLTKALASPVAAVFLQPRAQNPTGISLTPSRARQIADALSLQSPPVIEDDATGAVASAPAISLGQWLPEQTLHIRSFSKSHGPDLRLAALSGPSTLINQIIHRRQLGQGWSSRLLQTVLLNLLTDPHTIKQVAHARSEYQRRRDLLRNPCPDKEYPSAEMTASTSGSPFTTRPPPPSDSPARGSASPPDRPFKSCQSKTPTYASPADSSAADTRNWGRASPPRHRPARGGSRDDRLSYAGRQRSSGAGQVAELPSHRGRVASSTGFSSRRVTTYA